MTPADSRVVFHLAGDAKKCVSSLIERRQARTHTVRKEEEKWVRRRRHSIPHADPFSAPNEDVSVSSRAKNSSLATTKPRSRPPKNFVSNMQQLRNSGKKEIIFDAPLFPVLKRKRKLCNQRES